MPNIDFAVYSFARQCMPLLLDLPILCTCPAVTNSASQDPSRPAPVIAEAHPTHAQRCSLAGCLDRRHNRGCAGLQELLMTVPYFSVNPQFHLRINNRMVPDFDVFNMPAIGNMAFVEYSVVDPLQAHHLHGSTRTSGVAARRRDEEKRRKYRDLCIRTQHQFYAASQETTGRISDGYRALFDLCKLTHDVDRFDSFAHERTWTSRGYSQYYTQRIALSFFSGCADMHMTRERINSFRSGLPHDLINTNWPSLQSVST